MPITLSTDLATYKINIAQDGGKAQVMDTTYPQYDHRAPPLRLLHTDPPLHRSKQTARVHIWIDDWHKNSPRGLESTERGIILTEGHASGLNLTWSTWKTLYQLCVKHERCKTLMKTWNYQTEDTCSCELMQTMSHLLECANTPQCSPHNLAKTAPSAVA